MRTILHFLTCFFLAVGMISCGDQPNLLVESANSGKTVHAPKAMVVSAHPEATKVGHDILVEGGNAIDAMVGVHFVLAVVYPSAGNIGGGGFMVYRQHDGEVYTLDFREKAPGAAHEDMYLDSLGNVIPGQSLYGQMAAGVPGSVDGMLRAHERFGELTLERLIQPAIDLAAKGFPITQQQANNYNRLQDDFTQYNRNPESVALIKDTPWTKGDLLVQEDLAETLVRIRQEGRAGFYQGETAHLLVAEMEAGNGIITLDDLKDYQSVWREPITGSYRGHTVYSMGPSSSGGIALLQLLKMSEQYPLREHGAKTAQTVHLMTEMERRVYADRAEHLGDADFWDVPFDALLSDAYLLERVSQIQADSATDSEQVRPMELDNLVESEETTHYSIIDQQGNAISLTTTINSGYGAKVFVQGAGFLLNNEMDDFSSKPGVPNVYGLLGGEANAIQPGKRMLSAMTPTILEKNGELFMVVGTPGGSTIITSVYQTILNVIDHDMTMTEAVRAKRVHHQWKPNQISFEQGALSDEVQQALESMGHSLETRSSIGRVDAILVKPDGTYEGAADPRGDDWAIGL